ncbi:Tfp pilus assembly protein, tip-associated adhesin PilY1 [Delftia tsuruhatensis]|uniref:pilus assembly protein n=1 Tax=Delftia tsuruhatensis TaxID=180282 RepID=UPI001E7B851E|nr:PilC/PilY family type IV pilus protein [Delftia tsuruhatensis]CAB5656669.1 Tfp pilus assembly protein, tip-associated adhesin PilY1 [Delftia tsuruhatensis]CAC9679004.1 Tfp pilus assembly protein, tip-associated adhesin PilY1 [Delftia tsuruhatensis]
MKQHIPFKATLLAAMTATAWAPASGWAQTLNLAQSPPATVEPFVAPNVILSLDDSGSMRYRINSTTALGDQTITQPDSNGSWSIRASRVNILRHALKTVFEDHQLLPDGSIRFAWQTMGRCGNGGDGWTAMTLDASRRDTHSIRVLDSTHRQNFLNYIDKLTGCAWTPTHTMVSQADRYMRAKLNINGPWASEPGEKDTPYLGCRRNYHILMTDGGWNYAIRSPGNQIPDSPNFDGTGRTLPDSTPYATTDPQTQIYRDNDAGSFSTIADWAFKSWADPLQTTGLTGSPRTSTEYNRAPPQETFTSSTNKASSITLKKYWNPRYNPATWPHMATFTVGFSQYALPQFNYTANGRTPIASPPSGTVPYGYDGNFADYANGTFAWRAAGSMTTDQSLPGDDQADRGHDMWHAAINGRGKFYAVNRSEDLATAFRQIVQQINAESEPDRSSAATSGSTSTRNAVGLYTAHYDPQQAWKGWITAQTIAPGGATGAAAGWGAHTADQLDALTDINNRAVLTWNGNHPGQGVPFRWASLNTAQKAHLGQSRGTPDGHGENRLNYLRGERGMEGTGSPPSYTATRPLRQRQSRQGDIINSAIWYTGAPSSLYPTQDYMQFAQTRQNRTPMLYVGGNDGMLHGFSALDGSEKLAYVPRGVIPGLAQLTEPGYDNRHRYFVDGSPMTGDVKIGSQWKTLLVGTLGAGGKGYFALDATDPANFGENNAASLVLLDRSLHASETFPANCSLLSDDQARKRCEEDKDIGHVFAPPVLDDSNPQRTTQITQLNDGRWAVVMGNGYNSRNGRAVLLIQYLDQGRELLRLPTPAGTPGNGLSAPRLVDINGDGRPDVVYAGDLRGNLWKFLIASDDPSSWEVAFGGQPLFQVDNSRAPSITAAPTVRANDRRQVMKNSAGQDENLAVGGMMVAFGTGRNVTVQDPVNPQAGTLYSVLDSTRYKRAGGGARVEPCLSTADADCKLRADQVPRPTSPHELIDLAQAGANTTGTGASAGRNFWQVNGGGVNWTTQRGWRFTLPEVGERLLKPMAFFDGSNILAIHTQIPAQGDGIDGVAAGPQETCEATAVNGERQFLTLLNIMDGKRPSVQVMDTNGDGVYNAADGNMHRMTVSKGAQTQIIQGERIVMKGDKDEENILARMPEQPARPSWRQMQ